MWRRQRALWAVLCNASMPQAARTRSQPARQLKEPWHPTPFAVAFCSNRRTCHRHPQLVGFVGVVVQRSEVRLELQGKQSVCNRLKNRGVSTGLVGVVIQRSEVRLELQTQRSNSTL